MFVRGVEDGPDDVAYREVPFAPLPFSGLWVSETGILRRRFFNPFTQVWVWGDPLTVHSDDNGVAFVYTNKRRLNIKRALKIAWGIEDDVTDESEVELEGETDEDEEWSVMPSDWMRNSAETSLLGNYSLCSSHSGLIKVKNRQGEVVQAVKQGAKQLVCIPELGCLDVSAFHGQKPKSRAPRYLRKLFHFLRSTKVSAESLQTYADANSLRVSTVWTYLYQLCTILDAQAALKLVSPLLCEDVFLAMKRIMEKEEEYIFSYPAKDYMKSIDASLVDSPTWKCLPTRFEQIRILKLVLQKMVHESNLSHHTT